jgi:uncharacterized protein (TIGR02611 family)
VTTGEPSPERHIGALRWIRRAVILVTGVTVVLVGIVMIVAPGPAVLVIPLGLVILATEFVWARRILTRVREHLRAHGVDPIAKSPRLRRWMAWLGLGDRGDAPPGAPPTGGSSAGGS